MSSDSNQQPGNSSRVIEIDVNTVQGGKDRL